MKLSSTSVAKLLLILSIVIAAISAWKGSTWRQEATRYASQVRQLKEDERRALQESEVLARMLPGGEAPLELVHAVTDVLAAIHRWQLAYQVNIASITPQVTGGTGTLQGLETLSSPVANTGLRVLTISVHGSYKEYNGLREYLDYLERQPAALTGLKILGNTFELQLKVYGTL